MKKLILAAALCLSSSAFAYMCEVDMVDTRTNRRITTIRANDMGDACKEGMKACRLEIRQRGLLNRADCVRRTVSNPNPRPYPDTNPRPYPDTNPNPYPDTNPYPGSMDARRMLNNGESVVFNNQIVTVVGINFNGQYAVRSSDVWGTITNNVRREALSVRNGCNLGLCANDSVIDIRNARFVKVVGLSFNDDYVIQSNDVWNTLTSNVNRSNLAETKGCIGSYYAQICVGNTVIDRYNRYSTVAGLQLDGRVVLKASDVWNTLTPNVDPSSLVITR